MAVKWSWSLSIRLAFMVAYAALLMLGSLSTAPSGVEGNTDKLLHFAAYALFALIAYFPLYKFKRNLVIVVAIIAYGALIEVLQQQVGRCFSYLDMLANAAGATAGLIFAKLLSATKPVTTKPVINNK